MINDDDEVLVAPLVGDLIDPDPCQAIERICPSPGVTHDPADDRADGAPCDTHQLDDRVLRGMQGQPRDLVIKGPGVPGSMTCPRHRRDRDAMIATRHPRCLGLDEHHHRARIQRPPSAPSLARVVPG